MWFSFWRSRERFSLDELRYLTDQLEKVLIVNEVNKDFVIEALQSIAELITYGDQHDSTFFEFFMEKQVMGEFVRILKISRTMTVSLQLLQTVSIMIQNLKNENTIYYMFSNEHMNYLITYSFDFRNEELLSYYISFLRAISGKLNKNTISLLVKTLNDEVVSFPLYVEAIRFAFHEENMIRTAVRAVILNVYHVGDDGVNKYITGTPHADYFSNLITFLRKQFMDLYRLVSETLKNTSLDLTSATVAAVEEIEDNLYYISDVNSAGIPDVGRLITDKIVLLLIFPLLLPSLRIEPVKELQSGAVTSLYLLCCILRIVKIKDLANTIAAALFCPLESFIKGCEVKIDGHKSGNGFTSETQEPANDSLTEMDVQCFKFQMPYSCSSSYFLVEDAIPLNGCSGSNLALRDALLSYLTKGDEIQVMGSLSVLAALLQTKELNESMLDALGILPQRQQHKKLLLQALVGEASGEEQLFSSESSSTKDGISSEVHVYIQKIKEQYGVLCSFQEVRESLRVHRFQVLDGLVSLFCRSNISAETLWDGGWLLRQLLPYSEAEFNSQHLELLKDSYQSCTSSLLEEVRGIWSDLLITVLCDEWKKCKHAFESSSPRKEPKCMLFPLKKPTVEDDMTCGSSFSAGERMSELVKVFVLLYQLQIFTLGRALPEEPPIYPPPDIPGNSRAKSSGIGVSGPKTGTELNLVNAVPCRIAFERGRERHLWILAISMGTSGWLILAEELPLKQHFGVVQVTAPLAGCNPRFDDKHPRWLQLRIRPFTLPIFDPSKSAAHGRKKSKALVDGRWTLAFYDEESCKSALSMILEETHLQINEVEGRLKLLFNLGIPVDSSNPSVHL
ncbi:Protein CLEC16A like [Quillaja saponaria]|uniref:Protein CLEC16A like n=1 Tax=Quillaja saponaria TaxID=32244 RepID=A0AAD7QDM9_QUISA|nr:Protein CLEC16A like [Quillaja saponaria]